MKNNTRLISSSDDMWMLSMHKLYSKIHICMWDKESGQCIWESVEEIPGHRIFLCVAISRSGKTVIWGTSESVCQVRDTLGKIILSWGTYFKKVQSVTFSPDEGKLFIDMGYGAIEAWDIESKTLISTVKTVGSTDLEGTDPDTNSKPTPEHISGGRQHPVVHEQWTLNVHNIVSGVNTVISEEVNCSLRRPTFSPEGSKIAAIVADESIYVWETCSGCLLTKSPALKNGMHIHSLVFSPDGNQLLIHGFNDNHWPWQPISTQMWHINEEDNYVIEFDHDNSAAFFPNAPWIITISSEHNELRIWDMSTPSLSLTLTQTFAWPALRDIPVISSDGTRLLGCNGLWEINDFCFRKLVYFDAFCAKFSPNYKLVACTEKDGMHIFDAVTGAMLYQSYHFVSSLSFSPDSKQLCSIYKDKNRILVTDCSSTSIHQDILSHVYHADSMMSQQSLHFNSNSGWYEGVPGARIVWLPDIREVQLATGTLGFRSRYLIFGRRLNDITILDMDDYLCSLPSKGGWREGGIQYVDRDEEWRASALASSSRLPV